MEMTHAEYARNGRIGGLMGAAKHGSDGMRARGRKGAQAQRTRTVERLQAEAEARGEPMTLAEATRRADLLRRAQMAQVARARWAGHQAKTRGGDASRQQTTKQTA